MLILLTFLELLHSHLQRIVRWIHAPHRSHYRSKRVEPAGKHNHCYSTQKPEWLKHEIIRLKALMPEAGCRSIADLCNRRFAVSRKVTVGKTYVHQTLQQHDYEIQILRRNLKHAKPKAVPCNLIWGIDLTGKTDTNKNLHALLGILDHGSRALLHLQALRDKTSHTLIASISQVIRTHGKPKIIRTDNEAIFTSKAFRVGLKKLGIRHQRTDPGCPWQNGRIERFFGTLKQTLDQTIYSPLPLAGEGQGERVREMVRKQLNRDLDTFRYWYNRIRPHQNLNGQTPAEAWNGIDPYAKPPTQEHWFEAWDGLLMGYDLRHQQNRSP
ncbi:MAG: integrase core domain-containing protein [Gallionella sp.]|nr:integrase core domain-containing protein [Gallionella sp.]